MTHEQSAIYDIDVFGDGTKIDEFVVYGGPPKDFDPEKWIAGYKRYYPRIVAKFREITIKYVQRNKR
jgi:hypothetical protein